MMWMDRSFVLADVHVTQSEMRKVAPCDVSKKRREREREREREKENKRHKMYSPKPGQ
jgi:hypothetical protein